MIVLLMIENIAPRHQRRRETDKKKTAPPASVPHHATIPLTGMK
jgi:hypothetical protein